MAKMAIFKVPIGKNGSLKFAIFFQTTDFIGFFISFLKFHGKF